MSSLSGIYSAPILGVLLSGLGPIDWRLLFNVSQRTQPSLLLEPHLRCWHLDTANQDASNSHIL